MAASNTNAAYLSTLKSLFNAILNGEKEKFLCFFSSDVFSPIRLWGDNILCAWDFSAGYYLYSFSFSFRVHPSEPSFVNISIWIKIINREKEQKENVLSNEQSVSPWTMLERPEKWPQCDKYFDENITNAAVRRMEKKMENSTKMEALYNQNMMGYCATMMVMMTMVTNERTNEWTDNTHNK